MTGLITFENFKSFVTNAAPILGTALGSPFLGIATSLIADKFGVSAQDTEKLWETIKNDPESTIKLKQIENTHIEALQQIASNDYKTESMDRESARQANLNSYIPSLLAVGFLFNYAFIQFYAVTHNINSDILARFHDVLIMIMSYYFGSSHKYFLQK